MIVVDTNIIAYLFIPGDYTVQAKKLFKDDPDWIAPLLWRSEFRNVLALYLRLGHLSIQQCIQYMQEAEFLMRGKEYHISSFEVLKLASQSGCSAYDCEFIALAKDQNVSLITADKKILNQFSNITISLKNYK